MRLTGAGFRPKSKVRIIFEAPRRVIVGSAVIRNDGDFDASVVVPHATPGQHKIQIVGRAPSGQTMTWEEPVTVLADRPVRAVPGPDLTAPVLLALAVAFPLATWLVLEILALRRRRTRRPAGGN